MIIALSLIVLLIGACIYLTSSTKWAQIGLVAFGAGLLAFLLLGSPWFVEVFTGTGAHLH